MFADRWAWITQDMLPKYRALLASGQAAAALIDEDVYGHGGRRGPCSVRASSPADRLPTGVRRARTALPVHGLAGDVRFMGVRAPLGLATVLGDRSRRTDTGTQMKPHLEAASALR